MSSDDNVDSQVPVDSLIVTSSLAFIFGWGAGYKFHAGDDKIAGVFLIFAIIVVLLSVVLAYSNKYTGRGAEIVIAVAGTIVLLLGIAWWFRRSSVSNVNPDFSMQY